MKIEVLHTFKSLIAEAAVLVTILYSVWDRLGLKAGRRLLALTLAVLAGLSGWALYDFGHYRPWKLDQKNKQFDHFYLYVNRHDFFHYYMGSKYSPEVGYLDLYPCALIVDNENGKLFKKYKNIREQENYEMIPVSGVLADEAKYRALFTDARWAEFERDVLFFRDLMGEDRWQRALRDKGYNATPVWNMVAHALTNAIPVQDTLGRSFLLWLDILLIIAMFALLWWAFGWRTTLFAITFFGINFMMNQTHIKGSLLRLDWVTLIVMGICLVKKGYFKTSGALLGYAAMARIFPAIFMFGIGAKFLTEWYYHRKINWRYIEMTAAFAVTAGLLLALSIAAGGGAQKWTQYQKLIRMHNDDVVEVRAGFKYVFLNTYTVTGKSVTEFKKKKNQEFHDQWLLWWLIQATVLFGSIRLVKNLDDYEAIAYGFVPAYFLVAPTFYYYVMLIVPLLLFAPKLERIDRAVGLACLFAFSVAGYVLYTFLKLNFPLFYWNSIMYLGLAVLIMYCAFNAQPGDAAVPLEEPPQKPPAKPSRGKTSRSKRTKARA